MKIVERNWKRHAETKGFAMVLALLLGWTAGIGVAHAEKMCRDGQLFYLLDEKYKTAEVTSPTYYEVRSDEDFTRRKYEIQDEYNKMIEAHIPAQVKYEGATYNVTGIGLKAFENCYSLTTVTIPEGVEYIYDYAFENCRSLRTIRIPGSVRSIGQASFYSCDALTSVVIPEGVVTIGTNAFCSCDNLVSITLPSTVSQIDKGAFGHCYHLTSVTCFALRIPCLGDCFEGFVDEHSAFIKDEYTIQDTLYVPQKKVKRYMSVPEWRTFKVIFPITDK